MVCQRYDTYPLDVAGRSISTAICVAALHLEAPRLALHQVLGGGVGAGGWW